MTKGTHRPNYNWETVYEDSILATQSHKVQDMQLGHTKDFETISYWSWIGSSILISLIIFTSIILWILFKPKAPRASLQVTFLETKHGIET